MTLQSASPMPGGYDAAHTAAAIYRVPNAGYLRIAGADRLDFIQRQTTNDIRTLTPETVQVSVLTSGTARTLDVWRLLLAGITPDPDTVGVVTLPGRAVATAQYLQGRIFFMDKVEVTNASASIAQFEMLGPQWAQTLAAAGLGALPDPGTIAAWDVNGVPVRACGPDALGSGVLLLAPAEGADAVMQQLVQAGAEPLTAEARHVLRVEAGRPGPARELTSDFTPLEANLDSAISGAKGCYAGQEVIARQVTYDKIARRMVGLRLDGPVAVGARVEVDGRGAGEITSAAQSPRYGSLALAVLRRQYVEPGTAVRVIAGEDESGKSAVAGETAALPFADAKAR